VAVPEKLHDIIIQERRRQFEQRQAPVERANSLIIDAGTRDLENRDAHGSDLNGSER
jgi:hypothetical protein